MYNPKKKGFLTVLNTYLFNDREATEKKSVTRGISKKFNFLNLVSFLVILYLLFYFKNIYK